MICELVPVEGFIIYQRPALSPSGTIKEYVPVILGE